MRESMGIDDEGRLVYARTLPWIRNVFSNLFTPTDQGPDPDLFSYDDDIRLKYLQEPAQVEDDADIRSFVSSFHRLGYPLPKYPSSYLVHSFEQKFGNKLCDFREIETKMVLRASLSVVSISSFTDDGRRIFTCSGTVIKSRGCSATILTSASLLAIPNETGILSAVENIKISVRFRAGTTYDASLLGWCLHYNLAFLEVQKEHKDVLPLQGKGIDLVPEAVFALGRHYVSREFMAVNGESILKSNNFDCSELMFSSCKIAKCGIGGPLVNCHGDLVGLNFYDKDSTPYLPSSLVLKCWEYIETNRYVPHLYFGWKIQPLGESKPELLEKICQRNNLHFSSLLVEEVERFSPAEGSGIRDGDIIVELFGEPIVAVPVPKYAEVFLDKSKFLSPENNVNVEVKILRQCNNSQIESLNVLICATKLDWYHSPNTWPLPKAEWRWPFPKAESSGLLPEPEAWCEIGTECEEPMKSTLEDAVSLQCPTSSSDSMEEA